MRLLDGGACEFKELVSRVLTFDYLGALVASLVFPLFFVPKLGLVRTSLAVMGLLNAGVALWATYLLRDEIAPAGSAARALRDRDAHADRRPRLRAIGFTTWAEDGMYDRRDRVRQTDALPAHRRHAQRRRLPAVPRRQPAVREQPTSTAITKRWCTRRCRRRQQPPKRVLVLGGGDGLALREILQYPSVERVTLVDLDPAMTQLGRSFPPLRELNGARLRRSRGSTVDPRRRDASGSQRVPSGRATT